ncbi:group III truncated hemoglobin [uncultured Flavobacterium sp.]|uniref:group III truncated hemoglobin n=1 Tax=uncultured Flavobacterium sp. TaxID=165435 RepID=UPI0025F2F669|nr:group III truncated hemoglobin [uncultured Flavobacterium sp.]
MEQKKDIEDKGDLEILISLFYTKLFADNSINFIFTDIAKINLEEHLPILVSFWELSLFGKGDYNNNVLKLHLDLNENIKLNENHFKTWLNTFNLTVDENFSGKNAEIIKTKALSIATVMQIKLHKTN